MTLPSESVSLIGKVEFDLKTFSTFAPEKTRNVPFCCLTFATEHDTIYNLTLSKPLAMHAPPKHNGMDYNIMSKIGFIAAFTLVFWCYESLLG